MKWLLLVVTAAACLAGCQDPESGPVPTAAPLNPSGKPRNATEQAASDEHRLAGDKSNQQMAAAAAAMAAAKAKAGGK